MQVFGKTLAALALTLAVTGTWAEDGDLSGDGPFDDSNSVHDGTKVSSVSIYEDGGRVIGVIMEWQDSSSPPHGDRRGTKKSMQLDPNDEYIIGGEISASDQEIVYLELHTNKPGKSVTVGRKVFRTKPFVLQQATDQIVGFKGYVHGGELSELDVIWKCKTSDCT